MFNWLKKIFFVKKIEAVVDEPKQVEPVVQEFYVDRANVSAEPDFSSMTKLQLDKWARKNLGIDLDRRKTKDYMINEIKANLNKEN